VGHGDGWGVIGEGSVVRDGCGCVVRERGGCVVRKGGVVGEGRVIGDGGSDLGVHGGGDLGEHRGGDLGDDRGGAGGLLVNDGVESVDIISGVLDGAAAAVSLHQGVRSGDDVSVAALVLLLVVSGHGVGHGVGEAVREQSQVNAQSCMQSVNYLTNGSDNVLMEA
jgi:hypothetical protein